MGVKRGPMGRTADPMAIAPVNREREASPEHLEWVGKFLLLQSIYLPGRLFSAKLVPAEQERAIHTSTNILVAEIMSTRLPNHFGRNLGVRANLGNIPQMMGINPMLDTFR